jgi:hypothetical protein
MENEYVDLIAAGYDWECPNCGAMNNVDVIPDRMAVTCEEMRERVPHLSDSGTRL